MKHALSVTLVLALALALAAGPARAAGPLGDDGQRITTSDYAIDLAAGPVLAGPRALGLGGAYVAIAEGVDGDVMNPASPAVRAAWSSTHVDGDVTLGLLFPVSFTSSDFYNTGRGRTDLRSTDQRQLSFIAPLGNLQIGPWGIGFGGELLRLGLMRRPSTTGGGEDELVRAQVSTIRSFVARAVDDGQLVAGVGFHVTALDVTTRDEIISRKGNVFTTRGVSFEGGILWRPSNLPFRMGMALRAPVITEVDSRGRSVGGDILLGDPSAGGYYLPRRVKRPWSADIGAAVQLGPRPLNVPWLDPIELMRRVDLYLERRERERELRVRRAERLGPDAAALVREAAEEEAERDERYRDAERERLGRLLAARYENVPRRYLLLSLALRTDGDVKNAVGVESFLQQTIDRSGESVTFSPRAGIETEPVERWLKLRSGGYWEPSRFREIDGRAHLTGGFDVRLFDWTLFGLLDEHAALQLSTAGDWARDYFGWALSVGVWR